jgi:fatty acid desaturase
LFVIGHDACHGSYTKYDWLNKVIGRIAFLPSLTPFSLWDVGHNVAHHGFTNLKGRDQVWVPMSAEEWQNASKFRRVMERIYRSGFGQGLYYLIEMWWKKLILPTKKHVGVRRAIFWWDNLLVLGVGRGVDHGAGAVGRLVSPLDHLDAARWLRAAVPGVQLHHGLRDLRAAHAPRSRLVRQARGMAEAPGLHHHHRATSWCRSAWARSCTTSSSTAPTT